MTANGLRLTRNVGFPKLTDSSAPASDAATARKRVTATFAVEFNVRGAFANLAPGEAYANARKCYATRSFAASQVKSDRPKADVIEWALRVSKRPLAGSSVLRSLTG